MAKSTEIVEYTEDAETGSRSFALNANKNERYEATVSNATKRPPDERLMEFASQQVEGITAEQQALILEYILRGSNETQAAARCGVTKDVLLKSKSHAVWAAMLESMRAAARAEVQHAQFLAATGGAVHVKRKKIYEISPGGVPVLVKEQVEEIEQPPNETAARAWLKAQGEDGYTDRDTGHTTINVAVLNAGGKLSDEDMVEIDGDRHQALLSQVGTARIVDAEVVE